MSSYEDAVAGINPINLTSKSTGTNILESTKIRKTLGDIVITEEGEGYSNRKSVVNNTVFPPADFTGWIRIARPGSILGP